MKLAIIQASPRSDLPTTGDAYQSILHQTFPDIASETLRVSLDIMRLERDVGYFATTLTKLRRADGILWIAPVYYTLVPAQLKRFIELLFARGGGQALAGKPTAFLLTSANFFDHTAAAYMRAVLEDLGLCCVDDFSATIYPVLPDSYRDSLVAFYRGFVTAIQAPPARPRQFAPMPKPGVAFTASPMAVVSKDSDLRAVLLCDTDDPPPSLRAMIDIFVSQAPFSVEQINIGNMIKTGCRGCCACFYDSQCAITDQFSAEYRQRILSADVILWAGTIQDRFLSATWKSYFDRSFVTNHVDVLTNKQIGLLISGPLRHNPHIRECLVAIIENQRANVAGIVTDEDEPHQVASQLGQLGQDIRAWSEQRYVRGKTYRSVGADKIFRDLVYILRFPFRADYLHFKRARFGSFPQKRRFTVWRNSLLLFASRFVSDKAGMINWYKRKMGGVFRANLGVDEAACQQRALAAWPQDDAAANPAEEDRRTEQKSA